MRNPAPFAGYLDLGGRAILSASPERFIQVHEGQVTTRPIKGTRPRTTGMNDELLASAKVRRRVTRIPRQSRCKWGHRNMPVVEFGTSLIGR